jgi:hypothetical protein
MTDAKVTYPEFLRLLADFIDAHPTLPQPTMYSFDSGASFQLDAATAKEELRSLGAFEKNYGSDIFYAKKSLGGRTLTFYVNREAICRKVVKGTRIEPEHYVAGTEGHIEPEKVVEDVEWVCDDPILAEPKPDMVTEPELITDGDIPF